MRDTSAAYGLVTRLLHALTAALLLWQFSISALYKILGETPTLNSVAGFGPHRTIGLAVGLFALARIFWALGHADRRPRPAEGLSGRAAAVSHKLMYALMLVVPAIAIARVGAKGKGWNLFGVELFAETEEKAPWVTAVADALHGPLSWTLLALIAVHAGAAVMHQFVWKDALAGRMFGRPPSAAS